MTDYRPVCMKKAGTVLPNGMDAEPRMAWLPISRLVVDDRYQRPLGRGNWAAIRKIAEHFRWNRFTPVLVSPVEGADTFALIDGQHRTHAAALAGHTQVPAMIVELTPEQQAEAFLWVNGQVTAVTPFHRYKAGLCSGDPIAVKAEGLVSEAGARLMTGNWSAAQKKPFQVYSIALILREVERGRGENMARAIRALAQSNKAPDIWYWGHKVLSTLMAVLEGSQVPADIDLARYIDQADLRRMNIGAAKLREQPGYASQTQIAVFRSVVAADLDRWCQGCGA